MDGVYGEHGRGVGFRIRNYGECLMAKEKKGLPYEQHKKLGLELYDMSECLVEAIKLLTESYRVKTKVAGKAYQALMIIDELRSQLEELAAEENPGLSNDDISKIYFCTGKKARSVQKPSDLTGTKERVFFISQY